MSTARDPYRFKEATQTDRESDWRAQLDDHLASSPLSNVEKLYNFPKYVPRATLTRYLSRVECFRKVLDVHGIVVECGVLFGGSLLTWAKASSIFEPLNSQRKVVGFDTFSGFPDVSEHDTTTGAAAELHGSRFRFENDDVYEELLASIRLFDGDRQLGHLPKVELVRGDVVQTIPAYLAENPHTIVSLLHLDMDLYEPTRAALRHFLPRMPKGAIVVFDQLNSKLWPGESLALLDEVGVRNVRIERFSWDTYISYAVL
jgi:hypothetical protein